ncbi:hypothetical protein [Chthonobacter albigriseus]|uniref:hypothetical protein n=1 Tax=Chthonobacter albigriseus TaxID=1683161 RepID=UPI0015EEBCD7|nr:hypothetical protein [Chthonobacter albigriseus]
MISSGLGVVRSGAVLLAMVLSACSSVPNLNPAALVTGGRDLEAEQRSLQEFAPIEVCPEVQVRDDTQVMHVYERGRQGDPSATRFQATITKFARDCRTAMGSTSIRVGLAGRLLSGRTAATGTVELPIRIALVKNGNEVVSSQLIRVPATINPGEASVLWTRIVDGITIASAEANARYVIFVGFDEGAPKS